MNWLTTTLGSSVGKKLLMALTGFAFLGFLAAHLAGNLTIYGGKDAFNTYAERLHSVGKVLLVFELGLVAFAAIHILTGLVLFYQNRRARPVAYEGRKSAGGQTLASTTMPYTGILILAFVVFHLANFTFTDKSGTTIFEIVSRSFQHPLYVAAYVLAMVVVAFHVRHGFWSAFQTLGANHPKYMPAISVLTVVLAVGVGVGFGLIPLFMMIRY
jgi:succinate dehydrogenase / fumarate reductase, cytochrome b subunit